MKLREQIEQEKKTRKKKEEGSSLTTKEIKCIKLQLECKLNRNYL